MNFKLVLEKLLTGFEKHKVRYALIGGFALGAWGAPRGTVDIDFLTHQEDMEKVDKIMNELDYECKYRSENVSQYLSPLKIFGEVDFLHAFRTHSLSTLQRAEQRKIFGGKISVKVAQIEDIIGFKLQAIANNESRKTIDLQDIESLVALKGKDINWQLLEEYFSLFGFNELLKDLKEKYHAD